MKTITTAAQYFAACGITREPGGEVREDLLSEFDQFEREDHEGDAFTNSSNEEFGDVDDDEDLPPLYLIDGSDLDDDDEGVEEEDLMFSA
jgi:hypothetical protein